MTPIEQWTLGCWAAFWAVWIIAWAYRKPAVWQQGASARLRYGLLYWATFVLLFGSFERWNAAPVFLTKIIPQPAGVVWLGFLLTALGLCFAVWARFALGRNWSSGMDLKEHHELVTTGPYGVVRNPIYTAMLVMFLGSALVTGTLAAALAFLIFLAANVIRIRAEESLMAAQFPNEYPAYARRVKRLVPFVW